MTKIPPHDSASGDEAAHRLARRCIVGGALLMLLGVILGAFGAHALQKVLTPQRLASYQTGVLYHLLHAMGLVLLGVVARVTPPTPWLARSATLLAVGIVLFAGSIYAITFGAPKGVAILAPVGGTCFMLGWSALALHARRSL